MNKKQFAAVLIAATTLAYSCGNNKKKDGGTLTTGENTMVDSSATTPAAGAPAVTASLDTMSQNFAMTAASGDMLEIQSSNMAMQHGSSDRVKAFAAMMIKDHGATTSQLQSMLGSKGVTLPTEMMPMHKAMLDRVQGKTGKEFDQAYAEMQVMSHQASVSLFERASTSLTNTDLKNFASQHLPHLRMHLDSARALGAGK